MEPSKQLDFNFFCDASLHKEAPIPRGKLVVKCRKRSKHDVFAINEQLTWAKELAESLSMESPDWRKIATPNIKGCDIALLQNLSVSVIQQAIEDYKGLESNGYIKNCKPTRKEHDRHVMLGDNDINFCKETIKFFKKGKGMDQWIDISGIAVDGNKIRKGLNYVQPRTAASKNQPTPKRDQTITIML